MSRLASSIAVLLVTVGCTGAGPSPSQAPSASPSPSPESGLYLRIWQTQALPPPSTFMFAPLVTVSDGVWIDSNVAIPTIFPGPLLVLPNARVIAPAGEQAIVDQARELGLLEGETDFTGGGLMPGCSVGHVLMTVGGTTYELTGDPARAGFCANGKLCPVDPGTPDAFAAFFSVMQDSSWLESNLGPSNQYHPERLAVLLIAPAADNAGIAANRAQWPLATDFADFGQPFAGGEGLRCAVVSGEDVEALLPALLNANQMTIFVDASAAEHSLNVRALVPGEESPCAG
jgi:hypothetical protein